MIYDEFAKDKKLAELRAKLAKAKASVNPSECFAIYDAIKDRQDEIREAYNARFRSTINQYKGGHHGRINA